MIETKMTGGYKIHKTSLTDVLIILILSSLVIALVLFLTYTVEYKWDMFRPDLFVKLIAGFFNFQDLPLSEIQHILSLILSTVALGFLTTAFGAVFGIFLGLLASTNVTSVSVASLVKGLAGFIRAVPTIIWVLILISGFGLTSTTAVLGMSFHSLAFFIKSYSEAFEEVDKGTIEALKATGASRIQIIMNAILPSAYTKMLAWIAMRSEINFAVAVVIGPAVGVPGTIGSAMNSYSRTGDYAGLGFSVLVVILVAFSFELLLSRIRYKSA